MWRSTTTSTQSGTGAWTAATPLIGNPTQMFWRWGSLTRRLHAIQGLPPQSCTAVADGLHPAVLPDRLSGFASPTACSWSPAHRHTTAVVTLQCSSLDRAGCLPSCKHQSQPELPARSQEAPAHRQELGRRPESCSALAEPNSSGLSSLRCRTLPPPPALSCWTPIGSSGRPTLTAAS